MNNPVENFRWIYRAEFVAGMPDAARDALTRTFVELSWIACRAIDGDRSVARDAAAVHRRLLSNFCQHTTREERVRQAEFRADFYTRHPELGQDPAPFAAYARGEVV